MTKRQAPTGGDRSDCDSQGQRRCRPGRTSNELTGELYARWFQFAAFCGSFRSHGRTWWTRLPWVWGTRDMGPREHNNTNAPIPPEDRRNILQSEMNNPAIEPVAKQYAELRYQLQPYTY
jgi:alpha-glucosidase (family GH31 glycosyl hydrolase)